MFIAPPAVLLCLSLRVTVSTGSFADVKPSTPECALTFQGDARPAVSAIAVDNVSRG
jgi:hypothetical protein